MESEPVWGVQGTWRRVGNVQEGAERTQGRAPSQRGRISTVFPRRRGATRTRCSLRRQHSSDQLRHPPIYHPFRDTHDFIIRKFTLSPFDRFSSRHCTTIRSNESSPSSPPFHLDDVLFSSLAHLSSSSSCPGSATHVRSSSIPNPVRTRFRSGYLSRSQTESRSVWLGSLETKLSLQRCTNRRTRPRGADEF